MALHTSVNCSLSSLPPWQALKVLVANQHTLVPRFHQRVYLSRGLSRHSQSSQVGNQCACKEHLAAKERYLAALGSQCWSAHWAHEGGVIAGSSRWFSASPLFHSKSSYSQSPLGFEGSQKRSSPDIDIKLSDCRRNNLKTDSARIHMSANSISSSRSLTFPKACSHENPQPGLHIARNCTSSAPPLVSIADWQAEMDSKEPMRSALAYLGKFTNHERKGVPKGAGTDTEEGFPLKRMELLMEALGNPVSKLKVVHVAGTKGKGSVVSLLAATLRRAKLKVGTYTSPHFLTVRERISVDGVPISPDAFAALVNANRPVLDRLYQSEGVTHFEVLTALAFKHFAEEGVDVAIMEAGLGGARDATNVIPPESLLLAVITAVHVEHLEALGGSLEAIVRAKCGIIKEGRPVLLAAQKLDVVGGVESAAAAKRASLIKISSDDAERVREAVQSSSPSTRTSHDVGAHLEMTSHPTGDPSKRSRPGVLWENAAVAFRAAQIVLSQGFPTVDLPAVPFDPSDALPPGRMQCLSEDDADNLGVRKKRVVLDGAHTPDSFHELCSALADGSRDGTPVTVLFVIAMSTDKDHRACLEQLAASGLNLQTPIFAEVPVAGSFERATSAEALARCWADVGKEVAISERDFGAAIGRAAAAPDDVTVCVTGSMHVVGAALRRIAGIEAEVGQEERS